MRLQDAAQRQDSQVTGSQRRRRLSQMRRGRAGENQGRTSRTELEEWAPRGQHASRNAGGGGRVAVSVRGGARSFARSKQKRGRELGPS